MKKKFRCKIGIHKWIIGVGWSGNRWDDKAQRFDVCSCCDETRWVDDQKGYKKLMERVEDLSTVQGRREERLAQILDK